MEWCFEAVSYILQAKKISYHPLTMNPALRMLRAIDLRNVIGTLTASIEETWKLECIRERAANLICLFTNFKVPGFVSKYMTVQDVIRITLKSMVTAIHLMSQQHARIDSIRILGDMQLLTSDLNTLRTAVIERQKVMDEADLRHAALSETIMRMQFSDAVSLEHQAKLFEERRKRIQKEAAAAQTLAGMDFPWWPPEEPW